MKTSLYTVLRTAVRLGAVWLGVSVVFSLMATYKVVAQGDFGQRGMLILLSWAAITLLIAFLLWVYPGLLARLAAGKSATQIFESPIPAEEIQQIAMSVLGMWFAMTGLYSFAREILHMLFVMNMHGESVREANPLQVLEVIIALVRVAIGTTLVIGSRGLVGVIRHLRESGLLLNVLTMRGTRSKHSCWSRTSISGPEADAGFMWFRRSRLADLINFRVFGFEDSIGRDKERQEPISPRHDRMHGA